MMALFMFSCWLYLVGNNECTSNCFCVLGCVSYNGNMVSCELCSPVCKPTNKNWFSWGFTKKARSNCEVSITWK